MNMKLEDKLIKAPKSWENPEEHYKVALKSEWYSKIVILQDEIMQSTFNFFRKKGIRSVSLPVTTGSVTSPMGLGSDSLPVKVTLEGTPTYLADSMQFHLEYLLRYIQDGVHYIMPTFRGELADARHLCQFYHSEAEIPGNLENVINLVNEYVHHLCKELLNNASQTILSITGTLNHIQKMIDKNENYPRITMEEACELLENNPLFVETHDEGFRTITNLGEKELIKKFDGIVWLTHHDYSSVPFYQASDNTGKYALNGDLLFGIGEVVGSGERHTTSDETKESLRLHGVDEKEYEWYLYMKENFPTKTSGFGMGVERFILWLIQHDDIRDIQVIPRFNGITINP